MDCSHDPPVAAAAIGPMEKSFHLNEGSQQQLFPYNSPILFLKSSAGTIAPVGAVSGNPELRIFNLNYDQQILPEL